MLVQKNKFELPLELVLQLSLRLAAELRTVDLPRELRRRPVVKRRKPGLPTPKLATVLKRRRSTTSSDVDAAAAASAATAASSSPAAPPLTLLLSIA